MRNLILLAAIALGASGCYSKSGEEAKRRSAYYEQIGTTYADKQEATKAYLRDRREAELKAAYGDEMPARPMLATERRVFYTDTTEAISRRVVDGDGLVYELDSVVTDTRTNRVLHRTAFVITNGEARQRLGSWNWEDGYDWKNGYQ